MTLVDELLLRKLGRADYRATFEAMKAFTAGRDESTPDELWLLEHPPVYTLGQGAAVPALAGDIPLVQADRGGEITYHGPGQAVLYTLVDLGRRGIKVREFVRLLEQSVIDVLGKHGVAAACRPGSPGVYVGDAKIAALGLRVRRGCSYHGVALNVAMDLAPFSAIDPCGYPGLAVTQTSALGVREDAAALGAALAGRIASLL